MSIRIGIVEDNRGVRQAWAKLIAAAKGFECVGSYASGEAALAGFQTDRPEVVLMDLGLPGMSGIECTARLKEMLPQALVLVVTVYTDNENLFEALKAGASGYLLKCTGRVELLRSIREVVAGGAPMSGTVARRVLDTFRVTVRETDSLSSREQEILALLAQGLGAKDVAMKVGLTYQTVRAHLRNIYEKLHVHSRAEAVQKYLRGAAGR